MDVAAPDIVLPHQVRTVQHFAIDIGGSLAKVVYFQPSLGGGGGALHFQKFETSRLSTLLDFIEQKGLHQRAEGDEASDAGDGGGATHLLATGGGSLKYADVFRERLGLELQHTDEMECLVQGSNFLLTSLPDEVFTLGKTGKKQFARHPDIFPHLLVNIGSGVSIIMVTDETKYERVSGTSLGGGTFCGLGRLLTGCRSFDELLEMSTRGDNSKVDMLVGDIYGGLDYDKIGLSRDTIASSFGKVLMEPDKDVAEYSKPDIALALVRMISYNIGQIAYLNAKRYGLSKILFAGFFIRGHPFTMSSLSYSIHFWSKGEMKASFLRHEGFLGAMGAFLGHDEHVEVNTGAAEEGFVTRKHSQRAKFRESFKIPTPFAAEAAGSPMDDSSKLSWVEKFREHFKASLKAGPSPDDAASEGSDADYEIWGTEGVKAAGVEGLSVGILHMNPSMLPFPLLRDSDAYEPNTVDITEDAGERDFWIGVLKEQIPRTREKALSSLPHSKMAGIQGDAFSLGFEAFLENLRADPGVYGKMGLADLLEMREEYLRDFGFADSYRTVKESENRAAMQVLPDLLREIDALPDGERWIAIVRGALAGNIFDWGSRACAELYQDGTILDTYKQAQSRLKERPWKVDTFDALEARLTRRPPYRRAVIFVDNSGADVVLGMIPLARELLRQGTEVVMAANSLPALNDVTADELQAILERVAGVCGIIEAASQSAKATLGVTGGVIPETAEAEGARRPPAVAPLYVVASGHGSPCLDLHRVSKELAIAATGADFLVIEGMGRALHTNFRAKFKCDSLKLAMVKNQHLAETLLGGNLYDCVCLFEEREAAP